MMTIKSLFQWILYATVTLSGAALLPNAAHANCAGAPPSEPFDQEVLQRWNTIKDDRSYFWGKSILGTLRGNQMILTPEFDRLSGPEKTQVLDTLKLDLSTYGVYTADGRLLSAQYDGCTPRTPLLTERDRYTLYMTRPPITAPLPMLDAALRNAGQPAWRTVKFSIHPEDERRVRLQFWKTVGYDQYPKGWWIAWVPESGYFEITVENADGLTRIEPFLEQAAQKNRYVVLTKDGTPLTDTQYRYGNPWSWVLGAMSAPQGWTVEPCGREFLCTKKQNTPNGSVVIQRWDIEKMPNFQKELQTQGLTPGLITYANPSDRAKVLTAMKVTIAESLKIIRADRLAAYGTRFGVMERPPVETPVGKLPGLVYGLSSVSKRQEVHERYVSYMAFDGSKFLYIITTSFDPAAATNKFNTLADLDQFEPHLSKIVANLKLPHPDW